MIEQWKNIIGFEGLYQVSYFGRVKSKNCILKAQKQNSGYLIVHLSKISQRKAFTIHRLVAIHFLDNHRNCSQVNHKDFNKTNNRIDNLEWVNAFENSKHFFDSDKSINTRIKASNRMKIIGKKFSPINTKYLLEKNLKISIPILMLSNDGKIIKEYSSIREAPRDGYHNVGKAVSGLYKKSGGYNWIKKSDYKPFHKI